MNFWLKNAEEDKYQRIGKVHTLYLTTFLYINQPIIK